MAVESALVADQNSHITNYVFDADGRPTSVTLPSATSATTYKYDGAGQRIQVTDPDGRHRDWAYDQLGNIAQSFEYPQGGSMSDPSASWLVTSYGYDQDGELTNESRPVGRELCFTYDAYGTQASRYTVAAAGNCSSDPQQDVEVYAENPLSGITSATDLATSATTSINYDTTDPDRVASVSEGSAQTTYSYNPTTGVESSVAETLGTTIKTTSYGYDDKGRLHTITDPFTSSATTYTWKDSGDLATRTDPNGLVTTDSYDADGRLQSQITKQASTTVLSFTLGYDPASQITSLAQSYPTVGGVANPDSQTWAYTYYPNGELDTSKLGSGATTTYSYDGAGNRTHVNNGTDIASTYDGAGRLTQVGSTAYTSNGDDELTGVGSSRTYGYDAWGRTSTATVGSTTVNYAYDALDRTESRTPSTGSATTYSYDGTSENLVSATIGSADPIYYAWGPSGPLAQSQSGQTRDLIQDPHGDLAALFDTSGTPTGTISYDPWGNPDGTIGTDASQSLIGYQSQPVDPTTGLVDMGARLYDPGEARFTEEDSVFGNPSDPLTLNQYTYAGDSPLDNSDPTGNRFACNNCSRADQRAASAGSEAAAAGGAGNSRAYHIYQQQTEQYTQEAVAEARAEAAAKAYERVVAAAAARRIPPPATARTAAGIRTVLTAYVEVGGGVSAGGSGDLETPELFQNGNGTFNQDDDGAGSWPQIKPGSSGGETAGRRFTQWIRSQILEDNPDTCVFCRMHTDTPHVDHAQPRSQGGNATVENGQTTCPSCNMSKGARRFPVNPPPGYEGRWPPPWWDIA